MKRLPLYLATLILALGFTGIQPVFAQQDGYMKVEDVEELLDDYEDFIGKKVSVPGEVEYRIDSRTFVLESGGLINDEIVVFLPKGFADDQSTMIVDDADLTVKGTIITYNVVEVEREMDWDWTPEIEAELENVVVVLKAEEIMQR